MKTYFSTRNKMTFDSDSDSSATLPLELPLVSQYTSDSDSLTCYDDKGEEIIKIDFETRQQCCEDAWCEIFNDERKEISFKNLGECLIGKKVVCFHNLKDDVYGETNKASFRIEATNSLGTMFEYKVTFCNEHNGYYPHEYSIRVGTFIDYGSL
jgi:hypothetical protein